MHKRIREKEPVRPTTRLATLKTQELTTTAKRRSADTATPMWLDRSRSSIAWVWETELLGFLCHPGVYRYAEAKLKLSTSWSRPLRFYRNGWT